MSKWINVKDGLPEAGDRCLAYSEEGRVVITECPPGAGDSWVDLYEDSGEITHWMPLPEKPEDV